ncbi:hypothetical protein [Virgibacillus siamensis]|uniref:hypothetical protein n=1 Tax=Virgibacillus siamensis TaxID=480071 RepID=UPI0009874A90|nr:hypothetical protein [Virgibacillus siamensis]
MGHDISSYNKEGQEVGYVRFTMGDSVAPLLYDLLDSNEYYAGVSGSGGVATLTSDQVENAMKRYNQLYDKELSKKGSDDFRAWQQDEIMKFISNCLKTTREEGAVRVFFG